MGEDERFQHPSSDLRPEKLSSPSPMPSSTPSPSLNLGCTDEAIRDNSQVNAVTVHTLLDKLVTMLDTVQENQHKMEQRQISLEGSVKGIQNDLSKLSKYQESTSSTVGKLLEKSRKVSAHTRAVRERMDRQSAQVRRLENNHAQLLRRNHFKVLIFQVGVSAPATGMVSHSTSHLPCLSLDRTHWALYPVCLRQASVKSTHSCGNFPATAASTKANAPGVADLAPPSVSTCVLCCRWGTCRCRLPPY